MRLVYLAAFVLGTVLVSPSQVRAQCSGNYGSASYYYPQVRYAPSARMQALCPLQTLCVMQVSRATNRCRLRVYQPIAHRPPIAHCRRPEPRRQNPGTVVRNDDRARRHRRQCLPAGNNHGPAGHHGAVGEYGPTQPHGHQRPEPVGFGRHAAGHFLCSHVSWPRHLRFFLSPS